MPLIQAFPLALILAGTTTVILADGSTQPRLTARGFAVVEGVIKPGLIILDPRADDVLLGMEFLRKFGRALLLDPNAGLVSMLDVAEAAQKLRPTDSTATESPADTGKSESGQAPSP